MVRPTSPNVPHDLLLVTPRAPDGFFLEFPLLTVFLVLLSLPLLHSVRLEKNFGFLETAFCGKGGSSSTP